MVTIKKQGVILKTLALIVAMPLWAVADMEQNTINSYHAPISHCYHWLNEKGKGYLSDKYHFAQRNNGSITFYTTPGTSNGAVAGPGLYCAKSPVGSYSYGDRVIRLDFVDDIVLYDAKSGRKFCGLDGKYYANQSECDKKPWDIKFYHGGGKGNIAWYVIRDPQAIAQWSANSKQLESDLLLNKKFGNSSFQAHADQTLAAISRERGSMGELTVINHKARMNLMDVLNDPEEMKEIPPLNLIARVLRYTGNDLDADRKTKVLNEQAVRALNDIYLETQDIKDAIKNEQKLIPFFAYAAMDMLKVEELHKVNVVAAYQILKEHSPATLNARTLSKIWSAIFKSDNVLTNFAKDTFNESEKVAFFSNLPSSTQLGKMKIQNQFAVLELINKLTDNAPRAKVSSQQVGSILSTYLQSHVEFFQQAYDAIDNTLLAKEKHLETLFREFSRNSFAGLDPVYIGQIMEQNLKTVLDANTVAAYQADIVKLPLPVTQEETYKVLGKFNQGQVKLPSFFTEKDFLGLLFERSIAEQSVLANPTNTFRFILSGYYEYFNDRLLKAKDDTAKAAIQNQAESFFVELAAGLSGSVKMAYLYPIMQNASYFSLNPKYPGSLRYDVHPMEKFFNRYNQGDANFDSMLEDFTANSLDGSYLHFLTYTGLERGNQDAQTLLTLMLDTLAGDAFKSYRTTNGYRISDAEKTQWHNYIFNRHIANAGRNRAKSDFCGIGQTLDTFSKQIASFVAPSTMVELQALIDEAKTRKCF